MQRRRFCEILKPRRNGFERCKRTCGKLAWARRDSELAVTVRSRRLKSVADAAGKVRARAILKFIKPLRARLKRRYCS